MLMLLDGDKEAFSKEFERQFAESQDKILN